MGRLKYTTKSKLVAYFDQQRFHMGYDHPDADKLNRCLNMLYDYWQYMKAREGKLKGRMA